MSCGLPRFPSGMLLRYNCQGPDVLGLPLGVLYWTVPCVGPISLTPLYYSSLVQSMWSYHPFCVGSSDIYFPCSIFGGTPLSVPCIKFPWVHILLGKHCAASPLDAVWPHRYVALAVGRILWWLALPAVDFACDPSGFLLTLGSACGHLSL